MYGIARRGNRARSRVDSRVLPRPEWPSDSPFLLIRSAVAVLELSLPSRPPAALSPLLLKGEEEEGEGEGGTHRPAGRPRPRVKWGQCRDQQQKRVVKDFLRLFYRTAPVCTDDNADRPTVHWAYIALNVFSLSNIHSDRTLFTEAILFPSFVCGVLLHVHDQSTMPEKSPPRRRMIQLGKWSRPASPARGGASRRGPAKPLLSSSTNKTKTFCY